MCKPRIAYQVYSAREDAERDLRGVLMQISEMGYDGVEFAGFYGHEAAEVRQMLNDAGLEAVSSHVPWFSIAKDMFGTIAYHQTIGCKAIAVPFLGAEDRPGAPGFADILKGIYQFGQLCKAAGITLLYHNHDFEFTKLSGLYALDFLYAAVPADILQCELDTCWIRFSGEDPCAYLRKYAGRIPIVHLKDFVGKGVGEPPYDLHKLIEAGLQDEVGFEFRPVGGGIQDFPAICQTAVEGGARWFVVEQDRSVGASPLEHARMSRDYLKSIGY